MPVVVTPANEAFEERFLNNALDNARQSLAQGGFPAGSVIVKNGIVLAEAGSFGHQHHDPTGHSDLAALRTACRTLETTDLAGAALYSSVQPCLMCFAAANWSGMEQIFYACSMNRLDLAYYAGRYDITEINQSMLRPMELHHKHSWETASLAIVHEWEQKQPK